MAGLAVALLLAGGAAHAAIPVDPATIPWWGWSLLLFLVCLVLGTVAVPAGVGGGVLYVPIVAGFFPFHLDFVRGGGLLVALASALAASPSLVNNGLASVRLALPVAVLVSASQIVGASIGLALPGRLLETVLGALILAIVALMLVARRSEFPSGHTPDRLVHALKIHGVLVDRFSDAPRPWTVHRGPAAVVVFLCIGLLAGMFGLGAGWANVPALNLLMGAPMKVAVGTSSMVLSLTSTAAWVYLGRGALLPIIVIPSMLGMMLGARLGAVILQRVPASAIRKLVIAMLLFAGLRSLLKGLGVWP